MQEEEEYILYCKFKYLRSSYVQYMHSLESTRTHMAIMSKNLLQRSHTTRAVGGWWAPW